MRQGCAGWGLFSSASNDALLRTTRRHKPRDHWKGWPEDSWDHAKGHSRSRRLLSVILAKSQPHTYYVFRIPVQSFRRSKRQSTGRLRRALGRPWTKRPRSLVSTFRGRKTKIELYGSRFRGGCTGFRHFRFMPGDAASFMTGLSSQSPTMPVTHRLQLPVPQNEPETIDCLTDLQIDVIPTLCMKGADKPRTSCLKLNQSRSPPPNGPWHCEFAGTLVEGFAGGWPLALQGANSITYVPTLRLGLRLLNDWPVCPQSTQLLRIRDVTNLCPATNSKPHRPTADPSDPATASTNSGKCCDAQDLSAIRFALNARRDPGRRIVILLLPLVTAVSSRTLRPQMHCALCRQPLIRTAAQAVRQVYKCSVRIPAKG
ncbi:hypothetical protein LIA77_06872 [Sarocladium implicatum]|nr:hypothetical protein LIA77_06872 [Sarocladium implicatum]